MFQSAYAAAKGGVITLTKAVAAEYARRGSRINTVCPGGIETDGMRFYLKSMPEMREKPSTPMPWAALPGRRRSPMR